MKTAIEHPQAEFVTQSKQTRIDVEINLYNSSEISNDYFQKTLQWQASGLVKRISGIGDRALTITDYDPSGQVRFIKGRFFVVIYAGRPKYAEDAARLVAEQIGLVEKDLDE